MATVTGFDLPIDTLDEGTMLPGRRLEVIAFDSSSITSRVDGRLFILFGSFDFSSRKALAQSPVTGISIRLDDPGQTPVFEVDDFSQPFGVLDKAKQALPLILGGDDSITGSTVADRLFGHGGNDVIDGREGDDLLDGGTGADLMRGGPGDDGYVVDDPADEIVENAGQGTDTILANIVEYVLPANVENLTLGKLAGAGIGYGNELANILVGNQYANRLEGGPGDDLLDGGKGADVMAGGPGDDTYLVDNKRDAVLEQPGDGIDTVRSSIVFTLPEHVENLELLGKAKAGTGNELANVITGNAGRNTLVGGAGDDTLFGLGGKDSLEGGPDADRFVWLEPGDGIDTIRDFTPGDGDVLDLRALVSGFTPGVSDVADFLALSAGKKAATLALDADGADGALRFQAVALLTGFDATTTSVDQLVADGSILIA